MVYAAALLGPLVSPYDPAAQDRATILASPNRAHLLGTDSLGRDQFSRLLSGTRISIFAGTLASTLALLTAAIIGCAAGFFRGWTGHALMAGADLFQSLPWLYLMLGLRAFLPLTLPPEHAVFIVSALLAFAGWPTPARLIRGLALSARERPYVDAARSFGASNWYLIRRHILPETYEVMLVQALLLMPRFVMAEVTLSFLGLGATEPAPSLGNMLTALTDISTVPGHPWILAPGLVLFGIVACYQILADELQNRVSGLH